MVNRLVRHAREICDLRRSQRSGRRDRYGARTVSHSTQRCLIGNALRPLFSGIGLCRPRRQMISRVRVIDVSPLQRSNLSLITLCLLNTVSLRRCRIYVQACTRTTPDLVVIVILNLRRIRHLNNVLVVFNRYYLKDRVIDVNVTRLWLCRYCGTVIRSASGLQTRSLVRRHRPFHLGTTCTIDLSRGLVNRQQKTRSAPHYAVVLRFLNRRITTDDCCLFGLLIDVRVN